MPDLLREKLIEYKWFFVFFVIFVVLQVQSFLGFSWDPLVYLYQGKWFCGEHIYFEWLRPPIPGIINCLSGAGPYSTLISAAFSCVVYFAASILAFEKLKKNEKADRFIFAGFAFIFPALLFTFNKGGDLFALSFLMLSIAFDGSAKKGFFFALSSLSRYNFLLYIPAVLVGFDLKKLPKFFGVFFMTWLPWLLYNFLQTGNPFFSIEESVFLNVSQKTFLAVPDNFQIFLIGIFVISLLFQKKKFDGLDIAGIVCVLQFSVSGIKESRFLNALLPGQAANFSSAHSKHVKWFCALIFLLAVCFAVYGDVWIKYKEPQVPQLGYDCKILSDGWVYFYPHGIIAEPVPGKAAFGTVLDQGATIVIYDRARYGFTDKNGLEAFGKYAITDANDYLVIKPGNCIAPPQEYVLKIWRGD